MKTKVPIIVFGIFIIQLIGSCCKSVKYYDFSKMSYELSRNIINQNEELLIELFAIDLEYISSNFYDFGFSSALAIDCDDGWGGMKFPIKKIEILSTSNFNNEFSANEDLIKIFQIRKFLSNGEFRFEPVEEANLEEIPATNIELLLKEKPTIDKNHTFQIKLTKSNGEEIITKLEEIIWQ